MSITKRLWSLIVAFMLFVGGVVATQNVENLSTALGIDKLATEGPSPGMREAALRLLSEHAVPILAFVGGPFGLGFVVGAVLFSLPDLRRLAGRPRHGREHDKRPPPVGDGPPLETSTKPGRHPALTGSLSFDYSTNNGIVEIGDGEYLFQLKFSKGSNVRIHMYANSGNLLKLWRIKDAKKNETIRTRTYDSSSSSYTIGLGERFVAQNNRNYFVQGHITAIKDDTRGEDRDEVTFVYEINQRPGDSMFRAL